MQLYLDALDQIDDEVTTALAEYFWQRMTSEQKKVWKELAKTRNIEENRHGRRKLAGYWVFAKQIVATFSDQTKSVEDLIGFVVANLSVSELDMWETLDDVAGLFPSTGTNYTVNTWVVEELTEIFHWEV